MTIEDYNTSEDTIKYLKKLNEEYKKGFVDPESFTQTYDEYIAKYEGRSMSGQIIQLIKNCIREFEKEHGPITEEDLKQ